MQKITYAVVGTGDLAAQKAAAAMGKARQVATTRPDIAKVFDGLAERGEAVVKRLQRSRSAKRAVEATRQASRQLKGAVTSIRKAVGLEEQQKKARTRKAS